MFFDGFRRWLIEVSPIVVTAVTRQVANTFRYFRPCVVNFTLSPIGLTKSVTTMPMLPNKTNPLPLVMTWSSAINTDTHIRKGDADLIPLIMKNVAKVPRKIDIESLVARMLILKNPGKKQSKVRVMILNGLGSGGNNSRTNSIVRKENTADKRLPTKSKSEWPGLLPPNPKQREINAQIK